MSLNFNVRTSQKDEYLTPPEMIRACGPFDLDPCSPINRPWDTARLHYTRLDNGLVKPWMGRIWLNPPYGKETGKWIYKLASHGDGIGLVFARTETEWFQEFVFKRATAIFFIKKRIHFCHVGGGRYKKASPAPTCLVAYGWENVVAIERAGFSGELVVLK